jgi:hypothetical protein
MTPETNLEFIKSMGEQKEEENWKKLGVRR